MSYSSLFSTLWNDYIYRNPHASKVHLLFGDQGETIINDHVAFRTFNHPKVNIEQLANFFIAYGYEEKGTYQFSVKKLFAKHYEHKDPIAPKVFISELLLEEFSQELQKSLIECIDKIPTDTMKSEKILSAGTFWQPLSYKTYLKLLAESEYAAWMYAFGFCANHFTVNINHFKKLKDIRDVNELLIAHGFKLNTSGGLIKGTPSDYLEQSSTLAEDVEVHFVEGTYKIPSCYYEFAKRYIVPATGELYTGFVAASADKIFESTNVGNR